MNHTPIELALRIIPWFALCLFPVLAQDTVKANQVGKGALKVFILAGQSNMEGHARIETFDYIGDDPVTAPLLQEMRAPDKTPRVCDNVWISYLTGSKDGNGEGVGKLTAGFGSRQDPTQNGGKIGPEFTFGIYMNKALKEPILIIKTAWGGKSLHTDYRPPSAGSYVFNEVEIKNKKNTAADQQKKVEATGRFYHFMIDHVKSVLSNIKRVYPDYDEKKGYEIAGFVWLQGFNDLVARDVYLSIPGSIENPYAKYSEWLAHFIRDVRKDLNTPKIPFVIGILGVDGAGANKGNLAFREAMAAPASYPEFQGNVVAVQTSPFWDNALGAVAKKHETVKQRRWELGNKVKEGKLSKAEADKQGKQFEDELITADDQALWKRGASNAGYHYLGCAKTFAQMGKAFAEALVELQKK
jgi:hypothetical protein